MSLTLTSEERQSVKNMIEFLVKRKNAESGNHNGFHLLELRPIIKEMVEEGTLKIRKCVHNDQYFIQPNQSDGS